MTRDEWAQYEMVREKPDVVLAMKARCEEERHDFENCCSPMMQIYQQCKWCGAKRT